MMVPTCDANTGLKSRCDPIDYILVMRGEPQLHSGEKGLHFNQIPKTKLSVRSWTSWAHRRWNTLRRTCHHLCYDVQPESNHEETSKTEQRNILYKRASVQQYQRSDRPRQAEGLFQIRGEWREAVTECSMWSWMKSSTDERRAIKFSIE